MGSQSEEGDDVAETTPTTPKADASRRGTLSRPVIIDEAIAAIDEHGLESLTMRGLGSRLGVEAMALYRYVNGREDLLEGVVDRLVDGIAADPDCHLEPLDGWQGFMQWLAHSVRDVATTHPMIFPLVATRHPAAPWLRPPLRGLRVVNEFLQALTDRGFTDRQAVEAYRMFTGFLLGYLLLEVTANGASLVPGEPIDQGDDAPGGHQSTVDVSDYSAISRTSDMLADYDGDAEFEKALEALLDRVDHMIRV
jgi:TetR/AcrR family transcriptional regulator, tetracycline repressor protein